MAKGRKILYFIGAGASKALGAYVAVQGGAQLAIPTQADFWSVLLRLADAHGAPRHVESFLFRYFLGYRRVPARLSAKDRRALLSNIDVEEVFTFLSERSKAPSSSIQLKAYANRVWSALVQVVGSVFSRFEPNKRTRRLARDFYNGHVKSRDALVSFNYDTVFERSLPSTANWAYAGLEDCTHMLRVLKPHGSINWGKDGARIRRMPHPEHPIIIAPTHLKFVQTSNSESESIGYLANVPELNEVWAEMERDMKTSKILVFIGYSFPVADLYFSSVFRSALSVRATPPSVVLVNPDAVSIAARLQSRFPIDKIVKYFDFQQFVDSGRVGVQRAVDQA